MVDGRVDLAETTCFAWFSGLLVNAPEPWQPRSRLSSRRISGEGGRIDSAREGDTRTFASRPRCIVSIFLGFGDLPMMMPVHWPIPMAHPLEPLTSTGRLPNGCEWLTTPSPAGHYCSDDIGELQHARSLSHNLINLVDDILGQVGEPGEHVTRPWLILIYMSLRGCLHGLDLFTNWASYQSRPRVLSSTAYRGAV